MFGVFSPRTLGQLYNTADRSCFFFKKKKFPFGLTWQFHRHRLHIVWFERVAVGYLHGGRLTRIDGGKQEGFGRGANERRFVFLKPFLRKTNENLSGMPISNLFEENQWKSLTDANLKHFWGKPQEIYQGCQSQTSNSRHIVFIFHFLCINLLRENFFSEYCKIKPNLDHNYPFSIDLAPNWIPFGAKSMGTV